MTKSVIKICNFVHYFFREGGYLNCDQFSLLLFSLLMRGGRVFREIVPNSLYPLFIFLEGFPYKSFGLTIDKVYYIEIEVISAHHPSLEKCLAVWVQSAEQCVILIRICPTTILHQLVCTTVLQYYILQNFKQNKDQRHNLNFY